jgi:hypothetical protein
MKPREGGLASVAIELGVACSESGYIEDIEDQSLTCERVVGDRLIVQDRILAITWSFDDSRHRHRRRPGNKRRQGRNDREELSQRPHRRSQ